MRTGVPATSTVNSVLDACPHGILDWGGVDDPGGQAAINGRTAGNNESDLGKAEIRLRSAEKRACRSRAWPEARLVRG